MALAVDPGPSIDFVRAKGSARDRALLGVLTGEPLSEADLEAVREGQNPDGGFRVRELATQESVVGRTAEMVLYLAALGAADFGCTQAAADFLIERQRPDGTWGEAEALGPASPPAHFRPGSADVAGWETAATLLALAGVGLNLDARAPLEWIMGQRVHSRGGRLFRIEPILARLAFLRWQGEASEGASRLAPEVEAVGASLEVFELNWALSGARAAGVLAASPMTRTYGEALAKHRKPNGGFGSGPEPNGFETVLALCSLEQAGLAEIRRRAPAGEHEADPAKSDHGI